MKRELLVAPEGMLYTDGETYGEALWVGVDRNPDDFYKITYEEYQKILLQESENNSMEVM